MGLRHDPIGRGAAFCPASGKQRMTKGAAKKVAKRMGAGRAGRPVDAYLCRACGNWHVGNRPA